MNYWSRNKNKSFISWGFAEWFWLKNIFLKSLNWFGWLEISMSIEKNSKKSYLKFYSIFYYVVSVEIFVQIFIWICHESLFKTFQWTSIFFSVQNLPKGSREMNPGDMFTTFGWKVYVVRRTKSTAMFCYLSILPTRLSYIKTVTVLWSQGLIVLSSVTIFRISFATSYIIEETLGNVDLARMFHVRFSRSF